MARRRLSEEQLLHMTDQILEQRQLRLERRERAKSAGIAALTTIAVLTFAIAGGVYVVRQSPTVARLAPLLLTSPRLALEAALSDRMTFPRDVVQAMLLRELAGRGIELKEPNTRLVPPDQVILRGAGPQGPVQIELQVVAVGEERWVAVVRGMPGAPPEQRLDPTARLPDGTRIKRLVVEPEQIVVELAA